MRGSTAGPLLVAATVMGVIAGTCLCDFEALDMAPTAVDDQYLFCSDRMMTDVTRKGGLLSVELMADGSYQDSWRQAEKCRVTATALSPSHKTALSMYMISNDTFSAMFSTDTLALGPDPSVYARYFPYKSLHFLLTDAMRILGSTQKGRCRTVYGAGSMPRANRGSEVRLGHFFLASDKLQSRFGLTIRTCHAIDLPASSCKTGSENILVPPFEMFKVVAVKKQGRGGRLYLDSTGIRSNLDCAFYRQVSLTPCHCQAPKHLPPQPQTHPNLSNISPSQTYSYTTNNQPMRNTRGY